MAISEQPRQAGRQVTQFRVDRTYWCLPHRTASVERKARRGKVASTRGSRGILTSIELKRDRCYRTPLILHPFRVTRSPEIRFRNTSSLTGISNLNSCADY